MTADEQRKQPKCGVCGRVPETIYILQSPVRLTEAQLMFSDRFQMSRAKSNL